MKHNRSRRGKARRTKQSIGTRGQDVGTAMAQDTERPQSLTPPSTTTKMSPELPTRPSASGSGHAGMSCAGGATHPKLRRIAAGLCREDSFSKLSLEIMCHILSYLPLRDVVRLESLSRSMHEAVTMHLRLLKEVDFTEGEIYGWMAGGFNDITFAKFLRRCPDIVNICGLHLKNVAKRRQRGSETLSVPGIISALSSCQSLYGVETSNIFLLEGITTYLPKVHILKAFQNRNGCFPIPLNNKFELHRNPRITTLNLTGVVISELPRMDFLKHMYLKWVKLTDPHPFRDFGVPSLCTFVMNNCAGPTNALRYVPLITGLAAARSLSRLELVRVQFLGGLIQHVVEDSRGMQGFRQLQKVVFGTCKHALEVDLGYLIITCAHRLEELAVQPSLTKDSLFASLALADVDFPHFETLHLGFVDDFPEQGQWTNEQLVMHGLADISESPAMITDIGMRAVGQVFSSVKTLSIYNCPHLHLPLLWLGPTWSRLKELHLRRCHALRLNDFCQMIQILPSLDSLYLEQMFREPPKGCSRVGLSAGTGLGVSSALVQNSGNDAPNQDAGNNNPPVVQGNPIGAHNVAHQDEMMEDDMESDSDLDQQMEPLNEGDNNNQWVEGGDEILHNMEPNDMGGNSPPHDPDVEEVVAMVEQHQRQQIENDNLKQKDVSPDEKEDDASSRTSGASSNVCGCCCQGDPKPGPSKCSSSQAEDEDQSSMASSPLKCECYVEKSDSNKNAHRCANVNEPKGQDICCSNCGTRFHYNEFEQNGCGKSVLRRRSHSMSPEASPTRRSKRLRQSQENCDQPGPSGMGCESSRTHSRQTYRGKGKSLRGSKKGLVKKSVSSASSTSGDVRNQSCQAVSEEIRETTKKAKEKDEAAKKEGKPTKQPVAVEKADAGPAQSSLHRCPIHSNPAAPPAAAAAAESSPSCSRRNVEKQSESALQNKSPSPGTGSSQLEPEGEEVRSSRTLGTQTGSRSGSRTRDPNRKTNRRKPNMCDQATSTSDPVIEEDHVQILAIRSLSLVNLTLRQVGVTDLVIGDCPKLQMLSGSACRVLKNVLIQQAPRLNRISFAQCRKLRQENLVDKVCSQSNKENRLIFLRPMQAYDAISMERQLLQAGPYKYHVCLIHDHSSSPEETLHNHLRVASWLDIMTSINIELQKTSAVPEAIKEEPCPRSSYPWGRNIYRMQGESEGGHMWDLVSDLPWLRSLSEGETLDASRLTPSDKKRGLYNPRAKGHTDLWSSLHKLSLDVAEAWEQGHRLHNYAVIVYVNMCDLYGGPTPDKYI